MIVQNFIFLIAIRCIFKWIQIKFRCYELYYEATVMIRGRETTVKIRADKEKIKTFV